MSKKPTKSDLNPKRVTFVTNGYQISFLNKKSSNIEGNRKFKSERITRNTFMRCWLKIAEHITFDERNIHDESELTRRLAQAILKKIPTKLL